MDLPHKIKQLLNVYESIKGPNKLSYMSTSITTGLRFFRWYIEIGQYILHDIDAYQISRKINVIDKNKEDANKYLSEIQQQTTSYIINPTIDLDLTETEYMLLWSECIKKHVSEVIFTPNWEYSKGALAEFLVAKTNKIPCRNLNLTLISVKDALYSLDKSVKYLSNNGLKSDYQQNIVRLLNNIKLEKPFMYHKSEVKNEK